MSYSQLLEKILDRATPVLLALSPDEMLAKPDPRKWSQQEIMGHLVDSAHNNHQRFIRAEDQSNLVFNGYNQVGWVKRNAYQQRNWAEIVQLWEVTNRHLATLLAGLDAAFMQQQTTDHNFHQICMNRPQAGEVTSLAYLIWDYLFHLEHHLKQLLPKYERILPPFE